MSAVDGLSAVLLAGVVLQTLAGVGLLRLSNAFARLHAVGKPTTPGLLLVAAGAALQVGASDALRLGVVTRSGSGIKGCGGVVTEC